MVFDEPSTGLDPVARYELTAVLLNLMLDENNSVIFSSQHTQDVERLSDSIAFLDRGELISCQNKEDYLDKWRRIIFQDEPEGSLPKGLHPAILQPVGTVLIDDQFSSSRAQQLVSLGFEIREIQHLTLEEIFIQQTLLRRFK